MTAEQLADLFDLDERVRSVTPFGNGHINDTYLAVCETKKYILQRVNTFVFPNVRELMQNMASVCDFLCRRIDEAGGERRQKIEIVPTKDGSLYAETASGVYRAVTFVENSTSVDIPLSDEHFGKGGRCFATFAGYLLDYPADTLFDVIPSFHDTAVRYAAFEKAVKEDVKARAASVADMIAFVQNRKHITKKIVDMLKSGEMPLRVTHNDTKFNNLLLDKDTMEPIAVVDLDTIMKGSICYDFGDAIRAGCNSAAEDEKDLSKVRFDFDKFEAFCKGYLSVLGKELTPLEVENLAFSCILMTFECGMRFLTDYLQGDVYFKTSYPEHNVDRAATQFKLVEDMENVYEKMLDTVLRASKE